jgi:hypothetical protein
MVQGKTPPLLRISNESRTHVTHQLWDCCITRSCPWFVVSTYTHWVFGVFSNGELDLVAYQRFPLSLGIQGGLQRLFLQCIAMTLTTHLFYNSCCSGFVQQWDFLEVGWSQKFALNQLIQVIISRPQSPISLSLISQHIPSWMTRSASFDSKQASVCALAIPLDLPNLCCLPASLRRLRLVLRFHLTQPP